MPTYYKYTQLYNFARQVFQKIGCSDEHAEQAADVLISADLRGIDSHGMARLAGYVKQWEIKRLNPTPNIKIVHETPSTAVIDGDAGLGLVVAPTAMQIAIEKAQKVGTGWVAIKNSGHFGIAGYHAMMPLSYDMVGMTMTNASSLVTPTFSLDKLLGTNPIAVAVPTEKYPPFVADLATSAVAYGKMQILQRQGKEAPLGLVQNEQGQPSHNPHEPKIGGALLPLGSDRVHSSHKGYALGAIVDILSGVLPGANYGPWVPPFATAGNTSERTPPVGEGTGHFVGAMRIDAFRPAQDFKQSMDHWISTFKEAKAVDGKEVLIPGEPERNAHIERLITGIPVLPAVVESLEKLAQQFDLEWLENNKAQATSM
ncbi:Ldh family oxidoreductase [uncultured Microscilla sp.]|uniref:Ldh family oxidoreductase n=1 Tax=uncultured Microscilla sp. TaxID=432653 RepID=UPI002613EC6E|nr:Ldh family oxidoreductase [uncultured Microscilla sp.]